MSVDIIYADASDGFLRQNNNNNWTTSRNASASNDIATGAASGYLGCYKEGANYLILWAAFPFDTSGIPATAVISGATLNVKIKDDVGTELSYVPVQTSQATWNSLVVGDYDQRGSVEGSTRETSFSANTYKVWTLNATALGWIARNGETKPVSASASGKTQIGLRDGSHDIDDVAPTGTTGYLQLNMAETTGTTSDPYLEVTYTVPVASGAPTVGNAASICSLTSLSRLC